jgi:ribosomal protein S27AE
MMKEKRNAKKRTTPEMTAEERLRKWHNNDCPYCGGHTVLENTNARRGRHYSCGKCKAENYFSDKSVIRRVGIE